MLAVKVMGYFESCDCFLSVLICLCFCLFIVYFLLMVSMLMVLDVFLLLQSCVVFFFCVVHCNSTLIVNNFLFPRRKC